MSYDALRALIEHDEEIGSHPKQGAASTLFSSGFAASGLSADGAERAQPGGNQQRPVRTPNWLEQAETIRQLLRPIAAPGQPAQLLAPTSVNVLNLGCYMLMMITPTGLSGPLR